MEKQEYLESLSVYPTASNQRVIDELTKVETVNDVNERVLHIAAEFAGEGMTVEALDILDTVRAQMVDTLQDQKEEREWPKLTLRRDTIPCSPPFDPIMRPDEDLSADNPFDFTK